MNRIEIEITRLSLHPSYTSIYSVDNKQRMLLMDSILENGGLLSPIIINKAYQIIDGAQRYLVAKELGWETIPACIYDSPDRDDDVFKMISFNRHKEKTLMEKYNEMDALKRYWGKKRGERSDLKVDRSEFDRLPTRKKLALHFGISSGNVYKIQAIAEKDPNLLKEVDAGKASIHQLYESVFGNVQSKTAPSAKDSQPVGPVYKHCCPNCNHKF